MATEEGRARDGAHRGCREAGGGDGAKTADLQGHGRGRRGHACAADRVGGAREIQALQTLEAGHARSREEVEQSLEGEEQQGRLELLPEARGRAEHRGEHGHADGSEEQGADDPEHDEDAQRAAHDPGETVLVVLRRLVGHRSGRRDPEPEVGEREPAGDGGERLHQHPEAELRRPQPAQEQR